MSIQATKSLSISSVSSQQNSITFSEQDKPKINPILNRGPIIYPHTPLEDCEENFSRDVARKVSDVFNWQLLTTSQQDREAEREVLVRHIMDEKDVSREVAEAEYDYFS